MGRKVPLWQCLIVMLAMIGLLMWSILMDNGGEPHIALILAAAVATVVAKINGWKWAYLEQGILASINRSMQAILILGILGCLIASWMAAGTIPSMMYYGIKVISPSVFLVTACILCSIVSLATGSSWSTAGSMGVALIGVGTALGFPTAMTAGAVVSGAYFGDKMSPLSDTTNLAPACAGTDLWSHIRSQLWTTIPAWILAAILFTMLGMEFAPASNALRDDPEMLENPAIAAVSEHIEDYIWPGPMPSTLEDNMKIAAQDIMYNDKEIEKTLKTAEDIVNVDLANIDFTSAENLYYKYGQEG